VLTLEDRGFTIRDHLYPGLSRDEIDVLLRDIPLTFPEAFYELYQWHNGQDTTQRNGFLFAEYLFLPLQEAVAEYHEIVKYYDDPEIPFRVRSCFPFAWFDGDAITVYCQDELFYGLDHPIINIFHGIGIGYENIERFIRTTKEWYACGLFDDDMYPVDDKRYAIRDQINPRVPKLLTSL
jgi:hypothetical protein